MPKHTPGLTVTMKGAKTSDRSCSARATDPTKSSTRYKSQRAVPIVNDDDDGDAIDHAPVTKKKPFLFLKLPFELRLRIYEEILLVHNTLDLNPLNFWKLAPRLSLFLTCRQIHEEAFRIFYGQTIYLYPTHGRFFHTKKPLLARLSPRYREVIPSLAWRIGPGWGSPPRCQNTNMTLGLADCKSLRTLHIFIECDPSESVFAGFRGAGATEDTYKHFCIDLLLGIFAQVPSLCVVEIDAYPSVKRDSSIVLGLKKHIERAGKRMAWGPLRGWDKEGDEPGLVGLESALASMNITEASRLVEVPA